MGAGALIPVVGWIAMYRLSSRSLGAKHITFSFSESRAAVIETKKVKDFYWQRVAPVEQP